MGPKTSVRIFQSREEKNELLRYSSLTAQPEMAADGDAKEIQGQSLLAFGESGWGGGEPCSLGELLRNLSSLLGTFSQLSLMEEFRQDQSGGGETHMSISHRKRGRETADGLRAGRL